MSQSICIYKERVEKNVTWKTAMQLVLKLNYEALKFVESGEAPCRNLIGCLMYMAMS